MNKYVNKWINALESGDFKPTQNGAGEYFNGDCACAVGVLALVCKARIDVFQTGFLHPNMDDLVAKTHLNEMEIWDVSDMFERGKSFKQCAKYLRKKYGASKKAKSKKVNKAIVNKELELVLA